MKKTICLMVMLCAWIGSTAQDVMAQINAIKLKGGHLTAQYSHEVADSAFSMGARDILHQLNLKGYGLFTLDEILTKMGHLDMPRGNTVRVFTYLDMGNIQKKDNAGAPTESITIQPKFEVQGEQEVKEVTEVKEVKEVKEVTEVKDNTLSANTQHLTPKTPQEQLAYDIMAQKDLMATMNILKAKKNAGIILDYGAFAKGTNIDEVYIAIFDRTTNAPMTVLSPSVDGKRSNLVSKEEDSLSNYHGCKAIWISF